MGIYTGINERLKLIDQASQNTEKKTVAILGAGIAGLTAAYELTERGHHVQLFEAHKDRAGGRVWTHAFKDGQYHELGAMRIPASHDFTRYYINQFGLKLRPFITAYKDLDCYYDVNDKVTRIKGPSPEDRDKILKLIDDFRLSPKSRRIALESVAPAIFGTLIMETLDSLSFEDLQSLFGEVESGQYSENLKKLDSLSLDSYLDEKLNDPDSKQLVYKTTGLSEFSDIAITLFLRDEVIGTGNGLEELIGGMEELPKAFKQHLSNKIDIHFDHQVISIEPSQNEVTLKMKHNAQTIDKTFDYVICTIPYSKLRTSDIEIKGISKTKEEVIQSWGYASSTKVLLHCKKRFWETDDNILGGASISDKITKQTYYPSDNLNMTTLPSDIQGGYGSLYTSYQFSKGTRLSEETSNGPGVMVGSYCWGESARKLGALDHNGRKDAVLDSVSKFHPGIKTYVDDHTSIFWDEYQWTKAAFSFMKPGELVNNYHDAIANEGRLYFAGEHCSVEQGWIQGAMISALREVERILND